MRRYFSAAEEREIIARSQSGDTVSRNLLIEKNYPYLLHEANRFVSLYPQFAKEEVIGSVAISYIKAISKFNPDLGFRLSTLATYVIRNDLRRLLLAETHVIRIPSSAVNGQGSQSVQEAAAKVLEGMTPLHYQQTEHDAVADCIPDRVEDPIITEFNRRQLLVETVRKEVLSRRYNRVVTLRLQGLSFRKIGVKLKVTHQRALQIYEASVAKILQRLKDQGLIHPTSQGATDADLPDRPGAADSPGPRQRPPRHPGSSRLD